MSVNNVRRCSHCNQEFVFSRAWRGAFCSYSCRFWSKVNTPGSAPVHRPELGPCHEWTGALSGSGYGFFKYEVRDELAHRLAFFFAEGRWPNPFALHHCDNPRCVRREHLFEGDNSKNMLDCAAKGRLPAKATPEICVRGEMNGQSKLTANDVVAIRAACARGETRRSVAQRFGVNHGTVNGIVWRRWWRHVP